MIGYVKAKARRYLELGPAKYRATDFFGQLDVTLSEKEWETMGCAIQQMSQGFGFDPARPLREIGSGAIHLLLPLLHFEFAGEDSTPVDGGFLDVVRGIHLMDGGEIVLYNLVSGD